jgi:hypothetical protein
MNQTVRIVEWNNGSDYKAMMLYDGYKFKKHVSNVTGTIRWRCEACQRVTIKTKESTIVNVNDGSHSMLCKKKWYL